MRLPVVPQISTKDGTSNRNARLTNCLKESKKSGDKAVVRPGLVLDAQASGVGNGLVVFNNELVSVYGATLGFSVDPPAAQGITAFSPNINSQYGYGVSDLGEYIVGTANFGGFIYAYKWDLTSGLVSLGGLAANSSSVANAISPDGTIVVGSATSTPGGNSSACYWSGYSAATTIGSLGGSNSYSNDISSDGLVIVGQADTLTQTHAFRWTSGSGMVDLGTLGGTYSYAFGASSDGSVVCGSSYVVSGAEHPFIWTNAGGMVDLFPSGTSNSRANAINSDGSVVVGYYYSGGATTAFRWTQSGGMVSLGTLGGVGSYATGVSGDGSIVVGYSKPSVGTKFHAFYWTSSLGMVDMDVLVVGGASYAMDISDDASIVVGYSDTAAPFTPNAVSWGISSSGTIPVLATITGDHYDFAQSPL